jgi:hypothetical protein
MLCEQLTRLKAIERPSAEVAITHPWFTEECEIPIAPVTQVPVRDRIIRADLSMNIGTDRAQEVIEITGGSLSFSSMEDVDSEP